MTRKQTKALIGIAVLVAMMSQEHKANAQAGYNIVSLFDNKTVLPGGNTYNQGGTPFAPNFIPLNNKGEIAFATFGGVYNSSQSGMQRLLKTNDALPGGGDFGGFTYGVDINDTGKVVIGALSNFPNDKFGRYTIDGNGIGLIAREDGTAPDGGTYLRFVSTAFHSSINDRGDVAYWFETTRNRYGSVFLNSGGTSTLLAERGQNAPGGGTFLDFNDVALNNNGEMVFDATTSGGAGAGVYKYNRSGQGQSVVARGQVAAGGGTFDKFYVPDINDNGVTSFRGTTVGGPSQGVYKSDGTNTLLIAAIGQQLSDGQVINGIRPYTTINSSGSVAFAVTDGLTLSSTIQGIYVAGDSGAIRVIGLGDNLFGSTVTQLGYSWHMLNDSGQVAVGYLLADGRYGTALATPNVVTSAAPESGSIAFVFAGAVVPCLYGIVRRRRAESVPSALHFSAIRT